MRKILLFVVFSISILIIIATVIFGINQNSEYISTSSKNSSTTNIQNGILQTTVEKKAIEPTNSLAPGKSIIGTSISIDQLKTHNLISDCWVGYEGKVYDITSWLTKHPGGVGAILLYCGTATEFEQAFIAKHGKSKVKLFMKVAVYMGDFTDTGKVLSTEVANTGIAGNVKSATSSNNGVVGGDLDDD